jgi:hypothetical protein
MSAFGTIQAHVLVGMFAGRQRKPFGAFLTCSSHKLADQAVACRTVPRSPESVPVAADLGASRHVRY